ncbi:MAG: hypothetical protein ACR2O1_14220 [Boseongicola sp.]
MLKIGQQSRFKSNLIWIVLIVIVPSSALSQNPFSQWYTDLTAKDVELARNAAISLYEGKQPQVADQASWSSEETGAGGTVRIIEADSDSSCIVIQHAYKEGATLPEKTLKTKRCKKSDGIWHVSE